MQITYEMLGAANKATASVLLLYYHLIQDGGFFHDTTVWIDLDDFDGFSFLDVELANDINPHDIDTELLEEGAAIFLLCDLSDVICDCEDDFMHWEITKKIIEAVKTRTSNTVPEIMNIIHMLEKYGHAINYKKLDEQLDIIYKKYVVGRFKSIIGT